MATGKLAFLECIRKPIKNIVLYIILSAIFTGTLIGLRVYISTQYSKENALNSIGAFIQLSENYENRVESFQITSNMIESIVELPHVTGINQNIAEYAIPVNFKNVKAYSGERPDPNDKSYEEFYDITPDNIILDANLDNKSLDVFRLNQARLISGIIPDDSNPGLLIEKHLAEENHLTVGDPLILTSSKKIEISAEIIGIYETDAIFEITKNNTLGEGIFSMSPYNRIYSSLDIGIALYARSLANLCLKIIVDSPQNIDRVGKAIKMFDWDWKQYGLYNMTETYYQDHAQHIEKLGNYSKMLLFYIFAIGAIFLSVILTVFSRYYDYDSGILLALGSKKRTIIFQYFLSTLYIVAIAAITSIILAFTAASPLIEFILSSSNTVSFGIAQFENALIPDYSVYLSSLGIIGVGVFVVIIFIFLIFSCISPVYHVIRFNPREILSEKRR